jgi:hypothetical protein
VLFFFSAAPHSCGNAVWQGALKKKKNSDVPTYLFFGDFLRFSCPILGNILMVFLSSSCRETGKNVIKKIEGKNEGIFFPLSCLAKGFWWCF